MEKIDKSKIVPAKTSAIQPSIISKSQFMTEKDNEKLTNALEYSVFRNMTSANSSGAEIKTLRKQLKQRLTDLNTNIVHDNFKKDNERFDKEGISDILGYATSKDNIDAINARLDEMEGEDVWTDNILEIFNPPMPENLTLEEMVRNYINTPKVLQQRA